MASFETEKVKSPNKGDSNAIFNPPAMIDGLASPLASKTSKADINPINALIKPRAKASTAASFMCLSIFIEMSMLFLIFKTDLAVKYIDINKQKRIRDINSAPPSKNLLNNVVPNIPVIIAIILKILIFISYLM